MLKKNNYLSLVIYSIIRMKYLEMGVLGILLFSHAAYSIQINTNGLNKGATRESVLEKSDITPPDGYELIWSQEFDVDGKPDEKWWSYENGFMRNEELQWYQSDNISVKDGILVFEGRKEVVQNPNYNPNSNDWRVTRKQAEYTSGSLITRDKFTFKYGIVEVKARIDTSLGAWPAIWTVGVDRKWPDKGEIDVMEFYRVNGVPTILANGAWVNATGNGAVWNSKKYPLSDFIKNMPDFPERFHIWKMVWDENSIKLYLNDQLLNTVDVKNITYEDGFNPFNQPHHLWLNLAMGGNGGNPANSVPITYEVDYIRVFQKPEDIPTQQTNEGATLFDIDGNGYQTKEIGDLVWMTKNLKTTRFSNGDEIPLIGSDVGNNTNWQLSTTSARTVFRGDTKNVTKYGYLYNFYTIEDERGICPEGWRVPNEDDWQALETLAGVAPSELNRNNAWGGTANKAGGKLKSTDTLMWAAPNTDATDEFGFNWLSGSQRFGYGEFAGANTYNSSGVLWSSGTSGSNGIRRLVNATRGDINRNAVPKTVGACIRCVIEKEELNILNAMGLPTQVSLSQNYPNPFNPSTEIQFELGKSGQVSLKVFDLLGREVAILIDEFRTAGIYDIVFDASNLSSGVYMYQLQVADVILTKKMTLIK